MYFTRGMQKKIEKEKEKVISVPYHRFCWVTWYRGQSWRIFIF